jgi:PST family polysaccharide transporter
MKIFKKFLSLSALEYLGLLIPLFSLPIIASKVAVEDFAIILLITTALQFYNQIIDYSFSYHGARIFENEFFEEYKSIQSARALIFIITGLFFSAVLIFNNEFSNYFSNFLIITFAGLGYFFAKSWVFSYKKKAHIFAIFTFFSKLIYLGLALFYLDRLNLEEFLILNSIQIFVIYSIAGAYIYPKFNLSFDIDGALFQLKKNYALFITDFAPQFYITLPLIIFKGLWSATVYASLNLAFRIYNAGLVVQWSLLKVFLPENKEFNNTNFNRLVKLNTTIAVLEVFMCLSVMYFIIPYFFGSSFSDSYFMLCALSISYLFTSIYICYGHVYHVLHRVEENLKKISLNVTFYSVLAIWPVSYFYSAWGYISIVLMARLALALLCYYSYRSHNQ